MQNKRVCIYCASSDRSSEKHLNIGRELGRRLAKSKMTIVYGGSQSGVMGAVADGALEENGEIIGWIPTFMQTEVRHPSLTELNLVETMHQRKHGMIIDADFIIALPGGPGTLEEIAEAISWKRLSLITSQIFIMNTDGFYDPLLKLFENMFQEKFINPEKDQHWTVVHSVDEFIRLIT